MQERKRYEVHLIEHVKERYRIRRKDGNHAFFIKISSKKKADIASDEGMIEIKKEDFFLVTGSQVYLSALLFLQCQARFFQAALFQALTLHQL